MFFSVCLRVNGQEGIPSSLVGVNSVFDSNSLQLRIPYD